jgi:hypothetical protein
MTTAEIEGPSNPAPRSALSKVATRCAAGALIAMVFALAVFCASTAGSAWAAEPPMTLVVDLTAAQLRDKSAYRSIDVGAPDHSGAPAQ